MEGQKLEIIEPGLPLVHSNLRFVEIWLNLLAPSIVCFLSKSVAIPSKTDLAATKIFYPKSQQTQFTVHLKF
ncbi:MAG: hypothetical protein IPK76_03765 [Lewinellaceae bacterium]|nr:hypothetical protein [Lewinellaceae bacterium]